MNPVHSSDDELDRLLAGDDLPADRSEHVASCLLCRRRRDLFLGTVAEARGEDPADDARERVREAALSAWGGRRRVAARWWLAAAAAILIALLVPWHHRPAAPQPAPIEVDAVLKDVDSMLARDPLASVASEDVVNAVLPASTTEGGRGVS